MKRWTFRLLMAMALLLVALVGAAFWLSPRTEHPVGLTVTRTTNALGAPFAIVIWYPTSSTPWPTTPLGPTLLNVARDGAIEGNRLPLIVLSHGNGGGPGSHADLALALADAGYVVAAPMHTGDNIQDSSGLESPTFWSNRNQEVRATIDHLTTGWDRRDRIDIARVGAYGFSAGAFTVLTTIGGRPDLRVIRTHCDRTPEFVCDALRASKSPLLNDGAEALEQGFAADPRIRAAVLAAPGLGFTFTHEGLQDVRVPIQLWTGERDVIAPDSSNGSVLRNALIADVEAHSVPGAGHTAFLTPCAMWGPAALCRDEGAFDRAEFHRQMNAAVVEFFRKNLGA